MRCEICKKQVGEGMSTELHETSFSSVMEEQVTLYRVNPLGEKGIWRCWDCLTPGQRDALNDDFTRDLTECMDILRKEGKA